MAVLAGTAWADDASEAKLQFDLGQEFYKQKRFPEAVDHLIASNRLVPNANVVFNIASIYRLVAKAEQKRGESSGEDHFIEAYNWAETYLGFELSRAEKDDGLKLRDDLKVHVAVVDVVSNPTGADIVVDREALGVVARSPRRVAVSPGKHTIIAKSVGYREARTDTVAIAGGTTAVNLVLERITGILRLTSSPAGARVSVEPTGKLLGATPLDRSMPSGTLRIVISLEGYLDLARDVVIDPGAPAVLSVALQRAASSIATLSVTGAPQRASVVLDGRALGEIPISVAGLAPGRGFLKISTPGHQPWSGEIALEGGSATRVAVRLVPEHKKPWVGWKWLGYIGGSAVVASGAVAGLLAKGSSSDYWAHPSPDGYQKTNTLNTTADILMSVGAGAIIVTGLVQWLTPARKTSMAEVTVAR